MIYCKCSANVCKCIEMTERKRTKEEVLEGLCLNKDEYDI